MHSGLIHVTGRQFPTIWSFISSNQIEPVLACLPISQKPNGRMIREWRNNWMIGLYSGIVSALHNNTQVSLIHLKDHPTMNTTAL